MRTAEDIYKMIEEEDVEFIRLQFTDVWGNLKNMAVTPSQLDRVLSNKFYFEGSALFDGFCDYNEDLYLIPDLDSFVILPWRPQQGKVGKMICDVCTPEGKLFDLSPRTILKKVMDEALKKGYTFKINPECEFFLFHTDDTGLPTSVSHEKAGYLDVGPVDMGENARRDMVLTLEEMGFNVESSFHEKASGQHEIDFSEFETLQAADSIVTFRFAVRSIAKRFGLYATFLPKPITNAAGSGMHLSFTMFKDGKNVFESKPDKINENAKYFMGGIMSHAVGMCAVTNPIVNSYKRIMSGFEAPDTVNWSDKGENTLIKFHNNGKDSKVELRFPDSSANPYLAIAVCIAAGMEGLEKKTDCNQVKKSKLPTNLNDSLKMFSKDKLVIDTLGNSFANIYKDAKEKDWQEYMMQVSDWELNKYLYKM